MPINNYKIFKTRFTFLLFICFFTNTLKAKQAEFIQIIVYHFANDTQVIETENYLKAAYLPALHQQKLNRIGVFKPIDFTADKRLFVVIPYSSFAHYVKANKQVDFDKNYLNEGDKYIKSAHNNAPFIRKEIIFLNSFSTTPFLQKPNLKGTDADKVYELRSYESATELLHQKKVKMFNEGGETEIFSRLKFNPIFYGSVIAGSKMPNLIYLTSFENMEERKSHWDAFGADDAWKKLSALPEYKNTVSKNETIFLRSTSYSDL